MALDKNLRPWEKLEGCRGGSSTYQPLMAAIKSIMFRLSLQ